VNKNAVLAVAALIGMTAGFGGEAEVSAPRLTSSPRPGTGHRLPPLFPGKALFAKHQVAGLDKAERNAAKRERRTRRAK
jgi:hypothetical protein